MRDINPELHAWTTTVKTNTILADIADILMQINANLVAIGSGKQAKPPKPYPRPGKKDPENEKHFGANGLPPDELRKWFEMKRAQHHARNSTSHNYSDSRITRSTAKSN